MTIDVEGRVNFMNRVAESLSGWSNIEALGKLLDHVFTLVNEQTRQRVANPTMQALDHGVIAGLANHNVLIAKDGSVRTIDDSAALIQTDR
jgi:PAS domain S-box-containing protein